MMIDRKKVYLCAIKKRNASLAQLVRASDC